MPDSCFFYQEKKDIVGHQTDLDEIERMMEAIRSKNACIFTNLYKTQIPDLNNEVALLQQMTNLKESVTEFIKMYQQYFKRIQSMLLML